MDLIISDEVVEIQERKIIFEDEKEVFTIVKRGLDLVTETQVKEKNEHVEILFKNQIEFFSTIQKEPCLPRLFPNYFDWDTKLNNLCYFEEVASTFLEYLEQIKQQKKLLPFKELIGYFKTLLDGFCFLQLMGYETHKITIKSLFFTKEKEIKLMSFYAKHLNGKSALNCEKENALAFSILFLNILNLKLEFDRDKISLEEINDIEEKYKNNLNQNEKELMKKILKFLSNVANEKKEISLISLFIKTIQKINTTTLKKIILLEDDFKCEKNFDLVQNLKSHKKETFEIINLDKKIKIYGFASEQFFKDFQEDSEVPKILNSIKPIHSLNVCTLRGDPESDKDKSFFVNALEDSMFNQPLKTLLIQTSMSPNLVGNDHWLRFFWRVFYKRGQDAIEEGGLKFLHEHETYWDYGITDNQVEEILSVFNYPFVNSENLQNLSIFLQSWWTMTEDSIINLTKVVKDLKMKNIRKFEIGVEIRNLENRNVFCDLLTAIAQLLQGNDEKLECFSVFVYSNFTQDESISQLIKIFEGKHSLETLNLFISSISSKAPFEKLFDSMEDAFIANLTTLTLGFDSWVLGSSYVEDTILTSIWAKLKNSLSCKIKNFSFFILTLGIVEQTLDIMWNTMADFSLNTCNIYFVGYFHQKINSEHYKKKIEASLKKNNHDIDIGAFYFDFWK